MGALVIFFPYSFVAIKFTAELRYCILLGIFGLNLPIQWLLILGCTTNGVLNSQIWMPYVRFFIFFLTLYMIWGVKVIGANMWDNIVTIYAYYIGKNQVLCHSITTMTTFLRQFCLDVCNNEFFFLQIFIVWLQEKNLVWIGQRFLLGEKMQKLSYWNNEFILIVRTRENFAENLVYYLTSSQVWFLPLVEDHQSTYLKTMEKNPSNN